MTEKTGTEVRLDHLETKVNDITKDVKALTRFQIWLTGAAFGVGSLIGIFSDAIKHKVGLE